MGAFVEENMVPVQVHKPILNFYQQLSESFRRRCYDLVQSAVSISCQLVLFSLLDARLTLGAYVIMLVYQVLQLAGALMQFWMHVSMQRFISRARDSPLEQVEAFYAVVLWDVLKGLAVVLLTVVLLCK